MCQRIGRAPQGLGGQRLFELDLRECERLDEPRERDDRFEREAEERERPRNDDERLERDEPERLRDDDERPFRDPRLGTLSPSRRASDNPIAIACLRLVTFLPDRPERSDPCLRSCMALSTFLDAFLPYLRPPDLPWATIHLQLTACASLGPLSTHGIRVAPLFSDRSAGRKPVPCAEARRRRDKEIVVKRRRPTSARQNASPKSSPLARFLEAFSVRVTEWAGSSIAFGIAVVVILVWALTGPIFHYSDTWQLVINTGTTIVTFLMVFLIQRAQNKDSRAAQLKLNEIVAALEGASNRLINVEELSEGEIQVLRRYYAEIAKICSQRSNVLESHSIEEARDRDDRKAKTRQSA